MERITLTLTISEETRAMIKADAKALNMNPSGYVTMVCKAVNAEANSEGMQEFVHQLMQTVTTNVNKELKK